MQFLPRARLPAGGFGDALRPLVHRQKTADAVAGAMRVIQPHVPQELPRQRVELAAVGALRKHRAGQCDVAFQYAGKAVLDLGGRGVRPDPDGAGDVGGAIGILPTRIDQIDAVWRQSAAALLADAVMAMRAVGPGGADGIKRQIAQIAAFAPALVQMLGRRDFGDGALRRLPRQPVEEAHLCRAVAGLRGAVAGLFGGVFDRLGQHAGIAFLDDLRAFEAVKDRRDAVLRVHTDALARQCAQRRHKFLAAPHPHRIAQMRR